MEFIRVNNIEDPLFAKMHNLLGEIFPPEEVLEFDLWKEPLEDPSIRVFVAVHEGEVVGSTEYRYYPDWNIAMTDFTIIGQSGLGIGRFLAKKREEDLQRLAQENGKTLFGMFAEIYDPYEREDFAFRRCNGHESVCPEGSAFPSRLQATRLHIRSPVLEK